MSIRLTGEAGPLPSEGVAAPTQNDDYSGSWSAWADSADKRIESVVRPVIDYAADVYSQVDFKKSMAKAVSDAPVAASIFSAGVVATEVYESGICHTQ